MPKLENRQIQDELKKGFLWPVYWLYGQERMKARELLKRIRQTALQSECSGKSLNEESFEGAEVSASSIIEAARTLPFGDGTRFIVIRDAHLIRDPDELELLLEPRAKQSELDSVCIFVSKNLDGRKRFSKALLKKAAVVPCGEVPEPEREPWIAFLAKRRKLELEPPMINRLRLLDPWTLDIMDQELEKYSVAEKKDRPKVLIGSMGSGTGSTDDFLDSFFQRKYHEALPMIDDFAAHPEIAIPLVGLLAWNVRQLVLLKKGELIRLSPLLLDRLNRWNRNWELEELFGLEKGLAEVDFETKQTRKLPVGIWGRFLSNHCLISSQRA